MTVYELMQELVTCDANALVHFKVDIDADVISDLADNGESLKNDYLHFEEIYNDDTDVDIRLFY